MFCCELEEWPNFLVSSCPSEKYLPLPFLFDPFYDSLGKDLLTLILQRRKPRLSGAKWLDQGSQSSGIFLGKQKKKWYVWFKCQTVLPWLRPLNLSGFPFYFSPFGPLIWPVITLSWFRASSLESYLHLPPRTLLFDQRVGGYKCRCESQKPRFSFWFWSWKVGQERFGALHSTWWSWHRLISDVEIGILALKVWGDLETSNH